MSYKLQGLSGHVDIQTDSILRQFHQRLLALENKITPPSPPPLTMEQIQKNLSASGSHPLNVTSLPGTLTQPQQMAGTAANRPKTLANVAKGTTYYAYDTKVTSYWTGTAWV